MVKGMDFPPIWNTWLMGSQASSIYCSKEICALMLEIRKNFSRPQFRSAFTVTGSWSATMSSASCSRSHHVRDILFKVPCKASKRRSKFLNLVKNWRKFIKKWPGNSVFWAQRRQRVSHLRWRSGCLKAAWHSAQVSNGEPALKLGRPGKTPEAQKDWKTDINWKRKPWKERARV